jgi:GNAT superfamily N-acetyltransferase
MRFDREINERYLRLVPYAKKKYKFDLHKLDMKNISKEMEDIKTIIREAMPEEWADFVPPTDEEIQIIADGIIPIADPNLIYIARTTEGRPIGFNLTLPDYNQVLKKMNGRLFPTGIFKYLYYKNKINRARFFVLFVVPEYRKKGVPSAIYIESFNAARANGYIYGEGSTIWEYNEIMMRDIETFGGEKYKTYRIYKKKII